jgi:glucose-6-phosphate 1-dehydrogenase
VWGTECEKLDQNKLAINIYPEQSVELALNAGFSPLKDLPKTVELSFNLGGITDKSVFSNPYANVLKDVYNRDFLYAITLEEVLTAWKIIDKVMRYIDESGREKLLGKY